MKEYTEQERIDDEKSELLQDLITTEKVMEELWKYHEDNPKRIIIENEYNNLEQMKRDIQKGLEELS
jgi:hypothetical protein|tara:strand:+ start:502 stop:702 length:201 start_codon:yes stop_codon:yes gene_type:complete